MSKYLRLPRAEGRVFELDVEITDESVFVSNPEHSSHVIIAFDQFDQLVEVVKTHRESLRKEREEVERKAAEAVARAARREKPLPWLVVGQASKTVHAQFDQLVMARRFVANRPWCALSIEGPNGVVE